MQIQLFSMLNKANIGVFSIRTDKLIHRPFINEYLILKRAKHTNPLNYLLI